jgi:hypothetical protein
MVSSGPIAALEQRVGQEEFHGVTMPKCSAKPFGGKSRIRGKARLRAPQVGFPKRDAREWTVLIRRAGDE